MAIERAATIVPFTGEIPDEVKTRNIAHHIYDGEGNVIDTTYEDVFLEPTDRGNYCWVVTLADEDSRVYISGDVNPWDYVPKLKENEDPGLSIGHIGKVNSDTGEVRYGLESRALATVSQKWLDLMQAAGILKNPKVGG